MRSRPSRCGRSGGSEKALSESSGDAGLCTATTSSGVLYTTSPSASTSIGTASSATSASAVSFMSSEAFPSLGGLVEHSATPHVDAGRAHTLFFRRDSTRSFGGMAQPARTRSNCRGPSSHLQPGWRSGSKRDPLMCCNSR